MIEALLRIHPDAFAMVMRPLQKGDVITVYGVGYRLKLFQKDGAMHLEPQRSRKHNQTQKRKRPTRKKAK